MKTNAGIKIVLGLLLLLPGLNSFCQVGIGPGSFTPNASAALDIDFSDKGLLIPRVNLATAFTSISANAAGLMVYNNNAAFGSGTGFYYNTSNSTVPNWVKFGSTIGSGSSPQISFWNSGNSLSGDNNLVWDNTNKRLGIGTSSPQFPLHIAGSSNVIQMAIRGSSSQNNYYPLLILEKSNGVRLLDLNSDDPTNVFLGSYSGQLNAPAGSYDGKK